MNRPKGLDLSELNHSGLKLSLSGYHEMSDREKLLLMSHTSLEI